MITTKVYFSKGKTTAAYFTKAILDHTTNKKTALLSTMNTTLDGKTYFKSHLTTPESLDLYRMMSEAVENGILSKFYTDENK
ncbi:hypothetical protein EfmAA290_26300 [Enterococcus faecium]|nr:hypothetical protein EfmAA290_26300 [Enterococcus faecium]